MSVSAAGSPSSSRGELPKSNPSMCSSRRSPASITGPPVAARALASGSAPVTRILIAINLAIYLVTAAQGGGFNAPGGELFNKFVLVGPLVGNGGWWRLVTAMFLHGSILHIAFNMYALWVIGTP